MLARSAFAASLLLLACAGVATAELRYSVTLLSNVLGQNSAVAHQTMGTRIHRLMEQRHPADKPLVKPDAPVEEDVKAAEGEAEPTAAKP